MAGRDPFVLDDPVGESLRGRHAPLARRVGKAVTYLPDVSTFAAVSTDPDPVRWADLTELLGRGAFADMFSCPVLPPPDWEPVFVLEGRQMIRTGGGASGRPGADADHGVVELGADSVPEMLNLVERTRPGPFWSRTPERRASRSATGPGPEVRRRG
ncbi:hypothetical protein [Streptomyces aureus]|uniref:hypothetical protein n=1 Tax=Streptomyces aureus TaxID=193461 RepID=UPI0006E457C8